MAVFKCKMCGGTLEVKEGTKICECKYCGSEQTIPSVNEENLQNLFNRANILRMKAEFDKAADVYERIIQADGTDAEAYWGLVLCKYGVEYVEDPVTLKRVPTCHRTSYDAVVADEDYHKAIECADTTQRNIYEAEAKAIDEIQKGILDVASSESPYDVFICYKEADESGKRTVDSVIANDIYHQLTQEGFKVFYAAITLEEKLGSEYEPYIFSALNSAKVMLALGTKPEYFDAVWVKNEWSRFMKIMKNDRSRTLIPCYRDMDAYELPEEFAHLQAQDMSKIGFISDIIRGIKKIVEKPEKIEGKISKKAAVGDELSGGGTVNIDALLKRAFLSLVDEDWDMAKNFCELVLNVDPENGQAYKGNLCAEMHWKEYSKFADNISIENLEDVKSSLNYKRLIRFATSESEGINDYICGLEDENCKLLEELRSKSVLAAKRINVSSHTVGIKLDGTIKITGAKRNYSYNEKEWHSIESVAVSLSHTVGLRADGTVVAVGRDNNKFGHCNVNEWNNIVSIAVDTFHSYGLRSDGTVMIAGEIGSAQEEIQSWTGIVSISGKNEHVVGLKSDGTVVVAGSNTCGCCDVQNWNNIKFVIPAGIWTIGLKQDGTVVAAGSNKYGQCNVQGWNDIVAVATGSRHAVGLKKNGTVIASGDNTYHQCEVSEWKNIVSISASNNTTVGLKADGTVVTTGQNKFYEPEKKWNDIIALIFCGGYLVGIKKNGVVLSSGHTADGDLDVDGWRLFLNIDTLEDDIKRAKEKREAELKELREAHEKREAELREAREKREAELREAREKREAELGEAHEKRMELIQSLRSEKENLTTELANLKGLFTGKRRREIEARLLEIDIEIDINSAHQ